MSLCGSGTYQLNQGKQQVNKCKIIKIININKLLVSQLTTAICSLNVELLTIQENCNLLNVLSNHLYYCLIFSVCFTAFITSMYFALRHADAHFCLISGLWANTVCFPTTFTNETNSCAPRWSCQANGFKRLCDLIIQQTLNAVFKKAITPTQ